MKRYAIGVGVVVLALGMVAALLSPVVLGEVIAVRPLPTAQDFSLLQDTDGDTTINVELTPDADSIYLATSGSDALMIRPDGIVTIYHQSETHASTSNSPAQMAMNGVYTRVIFDQESVDNQSEFDPTYLTGNATASSAFELIDTTENQFTIGDVGRAVWNRADNTYTTVSAYNSASNLTLAADIMAAGELYGLYDSTYTASADGTYLVTANTGLYGNSVSGSFLETAVDINGSKVMQFLIYIPVNNGWPTAPVSGIVRLVEGDQVRVYCRQNSGVCRLNHGPSYLRIVKIT